MKNKGQCVVSGKTLDEDDLIPFSSLDKHMQEFVTGRFREAKPDSLISRDEMVNVKKEYLNKILSDEYGELDELEQSVIDSISHSKLLTENIEESIEEKTSVGARIADRIAEFGGSWTFILSFFSFIVVWVALNIFWFNNRGFDPYPFILLNLLLSCLAAIQAPIIMMSQNRQESKDRVRSEHDYKVNLKAELEIQLLHKKMDHLVIHQSKRLLEIQKIQSDMMDAILTKMNKG